jgi:hypothetical protein
MLRGEYYGASVYSRDGSVGARCRFITALAWGFFATAISKCESYLNWLQEEQDEHGQGKWEGKQKGKGDKRNTESRARQKESTALCTNLAD